MMGVLHRDQQWVPSLSQPPRPMHPEFSSAFSWRRLVEGKAGGLPGHSLLSLLGSCLLSQLLPLHRYRSPPWLIVCAGYTVSLTLTRVRGEEGPSPDGSCPSDCPVGVYGMYVMRFPLLVLHFIHC